MCATVSMLAYFDHFLSNAYRLSLEFDTSSKNLSLNKARILYTSSIYTNVL